MNRGKPLGNPHNRHWVTADPVPHPAPRRAALARTSDWAPMPLAGRRLIEATMLAVIGLGALTTLIFYLLSLHVTSVRDQVTAEDRKLLAARGDVTRLQDELMIRTRLPQVTRWNDVLALAPPRVDQYASAHQLTHRPPPVATTTPAR